MEKCGAFPGWMNKVWWVLLPGVLFAAVGDFVVDADLVGKVVPYKAEGLVPISGALGMAVVFWISVSRLLILLWLMMATVLAVLRNAQLRRREEWKLASTGLMLLLTHSRLFAGWILRLF